MEKVEKNITDDSKRNSFYAQTLPRPKTNNDRTLRLALGCKKKTQVESKIPISSLLSFLLLNYLLFTPVTSSSTKPRFKNCIGFHAYKQIMLEIGGLKSV